MWDMRKALMAMMAMMAMMDGNFNAEVHCGVSVACMKKTAKE
jgi:hypothetical protein